MPVYFLCFHSIPSSSNPEFGIIKGAYISAWIAADNISDSQKIAFHKIKELDWQIIVVEEAKEISKEFLRNNPERIEMYEQALTDKEVYTIHTYLDEDD